MSGLSRIFAVLKRSTPPLNTGVFLMAKQQTFGDKLKKKSIDSRINVKIIKGFRSDKGSIKFVERFVKVNDLAEVDKIDISK